MSDEPRECLWCGSLLADTLSPSAVFCTKSCRVQAAQWRARQRHYRKRVAWIPRKSGRGRRLWIRPRRTA